MAETLNQLLLNTLKSYPKDNFILYKKEGKYVPISTQEFGEKVKGFSLGLKALGFKPNDKLIILSENRPEWVMTDFATICLGGITVPVHTPLVPEQIKYIINNSDATVVVFSTQELWKKIEAVKHELKDVNSYITFSTDAPQGVLTFEEIVESGKRMNQDDPGLFERMSLAVRPDDIATIIYTSGTTGIPKGVILTHSNLVSNCTTLTSIIKFSYEDTALSFCPLSHIMEKIATLGYLHKGTTIAYAESIDTLIENLSEVRPQIMVSVPRVFEKVYSKVMDNVLSSPPWKKKFFFWSLDIGKEYTRKRILKQPIPWSLRIKNGLAHKLVFSKITKITGGRIKFFVSGGAPLFKEIAELFFATGMVVLEAYGLTETSPVTTITTYETLKFGTVGKPIPGTEVKIAEDGEILVRGHNVMKGYYKMEKETEEVLKEGWLYTGDIGHLDQEGYLVVTDRKKDLIITTGGKNVAPQPIENILKRNPYITNAVILGDRRRFISALIVPEFEKIKEYAEDKNIRYEDTKDLIAKEEIIHFIFEQVEKSTSALAPYEKIKKIALLERDFDIDKEEITPTLKVRRNIVEEKYKNVIESLYKE
jgi:long-chain acyl-CoA synthetase